ncbi:hypothetical protein JGH11_06490 [Dysgonomonas sp. Marseille-P4677]|uniref:hypothetical protein n=1 Tax=Dysgonomonas sp. Marseille-P4677 TaxID=2364790 RepID=UPI001912B27B|nr:hypothetical protein [Dysgonomonas sp. Marseille-P4677]MBK5720515.1 hypothetical protein [Dysgonomonas sp. Marseille-P4677]
MGWKEVKEGIPTGVWYWIREDELKTTITYAEPIRVELVSRDTIRKDDLNQFDLLFIESIISNIDKYLLEATASIKAELEVDPFSFGITDDEIGKYQELSLSDFPVEFPNIIFFPDKTWLIRFADADFPKVNYGAGIGVFFKENKITKVKIFPEQSPGD